MSQAIICDACGDRIYEESLYFDVSFVARKHGGGGVLPGGVINVEWDHEQEDGDLCDKCSEHIIEEINSLLNSRNT